MINIKDTIFNLAIDEFNKNKVINLEKGIEDEEKSVNDFRFDKIVKFKYQNKSILYCAEIKFNISNTIVAFLLRKQKLLPHPLLLITKHINHNKAEELKNNGIQFIDTAGNAYLNNYPIYVFIEGKKLQDMFLKNTMHRAFEPGGLKIIYALLSHPYLIKKPYRYIGEITNAALGTVGGAVNDLINLGFIAEMGGNGRKLLKKVELFNRWCIGYNEKLRPKLLINKFSGPKDWWTHYKLNPEYAQWGGEAAANKLTKYIKPQDIIIYAEREKYQNIVIENKLRKDINGDIEFLERFWKFDRAGGLQETVNPILIYADLMNTGNQRVLEMARVIYEKFIDRYIRET